MRLVFFYVSHRAAPGEGLPFEWRKDNEDCLNNYFATRLDGEGYYHMLEKVANYSCVDEVLVVIESKDHPGTTMMSDRIRLVVVPDIRYFMNNMMKEGDVLWARGGWRHWHDNFIAAQERGHWTMIYAANTGRQKWSFWDIVLDDLSGQTRFDRAARLIYEFRKPISEKIFKHEEGIPVKYDVMIGASRIHDKKGQWRMINALVEYKKRFGRNLKAVLPGPWANGGETNKIKTKIRNNNLSVHVTNELTREQMADIMRQSKVFVHAGSHGQGDRGLMEAMACGCYCVVGFPSYHGSWVTSYPQPFIKVPMNTNNPVSLCNTVNEMVCKFGSVSRAEVAEHYLANSGLEFASYKFGMLLEILAAHPIRDTGWLYERMRKLLCID